MKRHHINNPKLMYQYRNLLRCGIRQYFEDHEFIEVDTPILVNVPGAEVYLSYFQTKYEDHAGKSKVKYLRSSPELHMKRLIAQGLERIYQIAPCFRNKGELAHWHHPEFCLLEWYDTKIDYFGLMDFTENLIRELALDFDVELDDGLFPRFSIREAFEEFAGICIECELEDLIEQSMKVCPLINESDDFNTVFHKILLNNIEPQLKNMTACFLYDYPAQFLTLAQSQGSIAKRFELYLKGIEICNAFVEETSIDHNRTTLQKIAHERQKLQLDPVAVDENFLQDLQNFSLPPCCGNALGFDRLLAFLLEQSSLQELIPFRDDF